MADEQQEKTKDSSRWLFWFCIASFLAFVVFQIHTTQTKSVSATSLFPKSKNPDNSQDTTTTAKSNNHKTTFFRSAAGVKNKRSLTEGSEFVDENHELFSTPVCGFKGVTVVQSRPKEFFVRGPGKPFLNNIAINQKKLLREYLITKRKGLDNSTDCTRVYFHNHKVGGTTMSHIPDSEKLFPSETKKYGGWALYSARLNEVIVEANALQTTDPNSISLFTFVRDPVARFVSGLGQVLILNRRYGSDETNYCIDNATPDHFDKDKPDEIDDESVAAATISLMDCFVDTMSQNGIFLNVHLIPQVYEIYDDMAGYDLVLDIMSMRESIGSVRDQLGGVSTGPDAKIRPGDAKVSHPQFTLSKDTIPPRLIMKICRLYHVDVLYLNSLKDKNNDNQPLVNSVCNDYDYMT